MVKVNKIDRFLPTNKWETGQRFLWMNGYCREFCPIFATAVQPLTYI